MSDLSFIDSHAHLTMPQLWDNIEKILDNAKQAGIKNIINIATNKEELDKGILLKKKHNHIYNVAATTPHDVEKDGEKCFSYFSTKAKEKQISAIGEIGLDYYYYNSPKELQKEYLKKYLLLAKEEKLPIVIHCRDAFDDLFAITDGYYMENDNYLPAILHCFTGNEEDAIEAIKRGWMISFSGIITFKKSEDLRKIIPIVPLEQLLIETDSPYLAPEGHRGAINQPAYVVEVAKTLANILGLSLEKIANITTSNAKRFFSIP